jgi:DNA repair protein RecO (recombination protein O)
MLSTTKGIILHFIKFGETSVIATIYTERFGRQSYMVNSAFGKNAKNKASLLQPMFLLEMVVYHKQTREVQRLKEFKTYTAFQTIPFNVNKSAQTIFIAEVLFKLLREEESNPELYHFIETSILYLDQMKEGVNNFHLFFLAKLTSFLGIYPNIDSEENSSWLDMKKGTSTTTEPAHSMFMDKEQTDVFNQLVNLNIDDLPRFCLNRPLRKSLLAKMVDYYREHFESMGEIKSLPVLNEVFK